MLALQGFIQVIRLLTFYYIYYRLLYLLPVIIYRYKQAIVL